HRRTWRPPTLYVSRLPTQSARPNALIPTHTHIIRPTVRHRPCGDTLSEMHPRITSRSSMNAPLRLTSRLITAITLASFGFVVVASAQTVRYAVQDLGPVDSRQSIASSINDAGVVVGWVQSNNPNNHDTHAARTVPGGILGLLPGLEWVS